MAKLFGDAGPSTQDLARLAALHASGQGRRRVTDQKYVRSFCFLSFFLVLPAPTFLCSQPAFLDLQG